MSGDPWLIGGLIAFVVATITTPAGVSGAVFLLPVQVSVLHVANPALTPTNLLYNVIATPGALLRFRREGRGFSPLTRAILIGSLPGVVVGAVLRVEVFSGAGTFFLIIAAVLGPLGLWLAAGRQPKAHRAEPPAGVLVSVLAFAAGVIGGLYGIGGGSLLAPALAGLGFSVYVVAPAALTSTFATSLVGVAAFEVLQLSHGDSSIAPQWALGLAMGLGGLAGSYLGARLQSRVPERLLRRLLGLLCLALAARYVLQAAGS